MKAFVFAVLATAAIAVGAYYGLTALGLSADNVYRNPDAVRLD